MFQIDSKIVRSVYENHPNYKIDYDDSCKEKTCAIYFSSNAIYFPNTEEAFRKRIVEKDFFEWYHTRMKARKHIFVRDVFKQWCLEGINKEINSPERLKEWLEKETQGYEVVTIGSSAGGYAAVLYGSLLNAARVIAFNAQLSLMPVAQKASESHDPLVYKYLNTDRDKYYRLKDLLNPSVKYYYFLSVGSPVDIEQYHLMFSDPMPQESLCCIKFSTTCHGIPFMKVALEKVLNMNDDQLASLGMHKHHPLFFSMRVAGTMKVVGDYLKRVLLKARVLPDKKA